METALDEGILYSQEEHIVEFLKTTGELIEQNRQRSGALKVVILGRYESIALAEAAMEVAAPSVPRLRLKVAYFGEQGAHQLIYAYADQNNDHTREYENHKNSSVKESINAYFSAIERALKINTGSLWNDSNGRAFAGYAPVLAALGKLISEETNFIGLTNRLSDTSGQGEAWTVIDTVIESIMLREANKFRMRLLESLPDLPSRAYDIHEQKYLLYQHVHNQQLTGTSRVKMPHSDRVTYMNAIRTIIPEHPFVKSDNFDNAVLASVVLSYSIECGFQAEVSQHTISASRQPFLWRAFAQRHAQEAVIDGRAIGPLLNSYWAESKDRQRVHIESHADGYEYVRVPVERGDSLIELKTLEPITLFSCLRSCSTDISGAVILEGDGNGRVFEIQGPSSLHCDKLTVDADKIRIEGDFRASPAFISQPPRLLLDPGPECRVGWGDYLSTQYPWQSIAQELDVNKHVTGDLLLELLVECARRLPQAGSLTLTGAYNFTESDMRANWARRDYPTAFPELIACMLDHGLATSETMDASGVGKVRLRLQASWSNILAGVRSGELQDFAEQARERL